MRQIPLAFAAAAVGLALAACQESQKGPDLDPDACGASALQLLVGQRESALATVTLPAAVRIVRPGTAVTMDVRPDRLNIGIDARGIIVRVECG